MDTLRQRLQRLRPGENPPPLPATSEPAWMQRLARLREVAEERRRCGRSTSSHGIMAELPGRELAPGLRLHEVRVGEQRARLAGLVLPEELSPPWDPGARAERARLRLFDTETSGLSGGAGLKVFLIGVLRWEQDGCLLRQYLLTRPSAQAALVEAWVEECRGDPLLVSYNGKRFDVPALRALEILEGRDAGAARAPHWDLLYPVRRAFRTRWPDCRLVTAERMLVGRERHDDLPGSEAPRAWREYLEHGDCQDLVRVMQHNRADLEALLRVLRALLGCPRECFERPRPRARAA